MLKIQHDLLVDTGNLVSESLAYGLDEVVGESESLSGLQVREIVFKHLKEHYDANHSGKVLLATDEDVTADFISRKSRTSGIKQGIEDELLTFGLHAEFLPSVFTWYDEALWSFRHDVADNILPPLLEKIRSYGEEGLRSDYFNEVGTLRSICDSVASRVAFYSEEGEDVINLADVYSAFLEEEKGELAIIERMTQDCSEKIGPVPPPLESYGGEPEVDSIDTYSYVFEKHGITKVQFDSTIAWFSRRPELFTEVYDEVVMLLSQRSDSISPIYD